MPDEILINETLGIIEISSYGKVTRYNIEKSFEKTNELHETTGINKILVDTTRQESMPGTFDIFEIFSKIPSQAWIALIKNKHQATWPDIRFSETVAFNKGLYNLRVFDNKSDAIDWLNEK